MLNEEVLYCNLFNFGSSQFTVVTHSGPSGLNVPSHVDWELGVALVHVPIPHQQTVDGIVVDWDQLRNYKDVTHTAAQVKDSRSEFFFFFFLSGRVCIVV